MSSLYPKCLHGNENYKFFTAYSGHFVFINFDFFLETVIRKYLHFVNIYYAKFKIFRLFSITILSTSESFSFFQTPCSSRTDINDNLHCNRYCHLEFAIIRGKCYTLKIFVSWTYAVISSIYWI